MSPDLKAKVVSALRYGAYRQGHGVLRKPDDCFCVLGVVADQVDPNGWSNPDPTAGSMWRGHDMFLPPAVLDIKTQTALVQMNDLMPHKTFEQIADWMEGNL